VTPRVEANDGEPFAKGKTFAKSNANPLLVVPSYDYARPPSPSHFDFERCLKNFLEQGAIVHLGRRSHAKAFALVQ
jgi:hypothetical protein